MRLNRFTSLLFILMPVIVAAVLILGWRTAQRREKNMNAALCTSLSHQAEAISRGLNPEPVRQLTFSSADRQRAAFDRIRNQLIEYGRFIPDLQIYSLALRNDRWAFGPSTHAPYQIDSAESGNDPVQMAASTCWERRAPVVAGPHWVGGSAYFSAFAPVIDPRGGTVLMVVHLILGDDDWQDRVQQARRTPIATAVVLAVVLMIGTWLIYRRDSTPDRWRYRLRHLESGLVCVLGLAFTLLLVAWMAETEENKQSQVFERYGASRTEEIQDAMLHIRKDIAVIARFFESSRHVDRQGFADFVEPLAEMKFVQAYEWIPVVSAFAKESVEKKAQIDGAADFLIWEKDAQGRKVPASERAHYFPTYFAVSATGYPVELGGDLGMEPQRLSALDKAACTGLSEACLPVAVSADDRSRQAMILYQPVYAPAPSDPVSGRAPDEAKTSIGFVACELEFQSFFDDIFERYQTPASMVAVEMVCFKDDWKPVAIATQSIPAISASTSVSQSNRSEASVGETHPLGAGGYHHLRPLFIAGRSMAIAVHPTAAFYQVHSLQGVWLAGFAGTTLTLGLALFVGLLRNRQVSLENQVQQRTAALAESQAKINSIFRAAPIGIGLVIHRILQEANDRLCIMTGYAREELLGNSSRLLYFTDEEYDSVGTEKYRQIDQSGTGSVETRWHRKDGQAVHVILSSTPLDPGDLGQGVTFTAFDITDRKRREEEQQMLDQQIQQTQKLESLGVLAGGIAHDFNNILMVVLGHTELAMDEISPMSAARNNLKEIAVAVRRAADLCRQMLAYSGKATFCLEETDLGELIEEMVHLLKTSISKKAILNLHLEAGLPRILVDPTQIRQIVLNLIINAAEAIGDKSGAITLTAGATRCDYEYLNRTELNDILTPGLYVHLEVADTGCGMDKATRVRIFEPFFTTKFTGRGLGLAAVLGIVRAHKGAIKIYSEPDKGTTFKILFPAIDAEGRPESCSALEIASPWSGHGTVLLADDEESLRALGARMLERMGFTVLTAENGRDAVELYRSHGARIDLVLLDLTMPHLDGGQAFSELRQLDPQVRVVLASGYGAEDVSARFAGKGLAGVLQKPYTKAKLQELLSQLMP